MELDDNIQKYQYLASKWLDKTITEEELQAFNSWYNSDLGKEVELSDSSVVSEEQLEQRILRNINQKINRPREIALWPRIAVAMFFLILLSIAFYIYQYDKTVQDRYVTTSMTKHVAPGQSGATLILADGRQISLPGKETGALALENGVRISKTADGQLHYEIENDQHQVQGVNILSTSTGETYVVTLPDKSKVWLNAATTIEFAAGFNDPNVRLVKLKGEAYFEVSKDRKRPFIVSSDKQQVVVLGTHFNINTYAGHPYTETTLVEGSVKVTDLATKAFKILKPSEQSRISKGNIEVKKVDVAEMLAWKSGEFALGSEDFETTLQNIERWYNVQFDHEGIPLKDITLDGWISRSSDLTEVLHKTEKGTNIRFEIKGRRIIISR
ncbi:fec operon regulator FecR [compost metagenome]